MSEDELKRLEVRLSQAGTALQALLEDLVPDPASRTRILGASAKVSYAMMDYVAESTRRDGQIKNGAL